MKHKLIRVFSGILAGLFWYAVMPAQALLAASDKLNLPDVEPKVTEMPSMLLLLTKLVISLVIIIGLAYLTMKVLRKNLKVTSRGQTVRVLDQYAFSMNKGVFVTDIAGRVFVLGVTDHNINLLTEITDEGVIDEIKTRAEEMDSENIIPSGIMDKLFPKTAPKNRSSQKPFKAHIDEQINRLQIFSSGIRKSGPGDDSND